MLTNHSVWCNDEHELYDLTKDPGQLHNLLSQHTLPQPQHTIIDIPVAKVAARLDSLLFVLKSCRGERCVRPWAALHPDGDVVTLEDALDKRFDGFYETEQTRIKYDRCEQGYIVDAEGPQFEKDGLSFTKRGGLRWSDWT